MLLLYAVVVYSYNAPIRNINERSMEENSQVTSYLIESLNGIETIKSFNAERKAQNDTERMFIKFLDAIFRNGTLANSQRTLTGAIAVVGETVILWVGTNGILNGNMTIGGLITFNALMVYFLEPIKNLINLQPTMQTAIVAAQRLSEILELSPEDDGNEEKRVKDINLTREISIRNLSFRYGTREPVLMDINMRIRGGEKIALVGESGSGKTTLVKLLMNFYSPEKGEILFGDYNIKDINREFLRSRISYISQDVFLFSGTIRENLTLGNENASLKDVIEACLLSRSNEFIEKMPLRYDTVLDENGSNLSGGQKQRLAIARALLKNPDVLIMDEATSNLDSITEKSIENTINDLPGDVTTIIIAHRLSTILRCDKIFVFDKGRIIESGSHGYLMAQKGTYYELWREQVPDDIDPFAGDELYIGR
jgi:ATP-binding cassette subfamily B protein